MSEYRDSFDADDLTNIARAGLSLLVSDLAEEEPEVLIAAIRRLEIETRSFDDEATLRQGVKLAQLLAGLNLEALGHEPSQPQDSDAAATEGILASTGLLMILCMDGTLMKTVHATARRMLLETEVGTTEHRCALATLDLLAPHVTHAIERARQQQTLRDCQELINKIRANHS